LAVGTVDSRRGTLAGDRAAADKLAAPGLRGVVEVVPRAKQQEDGLDAVVHASAAAQNVASTSSKIQDHKGPPNAATTMAAIRKPALSLTRRSFLRAPTSKR